MCGEEWVKVAMEDDSVVVELLLRLSQTHTILTPFSKKAAPPNLKLAWTVRQRRSRSASRKVNDSRKESEPARASPTTPLSWSGATSGGGGDGFEESSRPIKPIGISRSKVSVASETTITKKSRKKTLAELKQEESLLLKEKRNLKHELEALHLVVEKHRALNSSLKRMKLELQSRQTLKTTPTSVVPGRATFHQTEQLEKWFDSSQQISSTCNCLHNVSPKVQKIGNSEPSFLLPDLNLPSEEDLSSSVVYAT